MRTRFLALLFLLPVQAFAWGSKGHSVVAELAERGLSPNVEAQIRELTYAAPLRDLASLPDDWRGQETRGERQGNTGALHYGDIPSEFDLFDRARDCPNDQCVVGGIEHYLAILKDRAQPKDKRREALIFVVHFVGDIHQPFHAAGGMVKDDVTGQMVSDQGGNKVKVRYLGVETNLHSVWDSMLIEWGPDTVDAMVDRLLKYEMRGRSVAELQTGSVIDWINESHYAATHFGYDIGNGRIGADYAQRNIGIVYERLLRGGLRLRKMLEDTLGAQ
jgi:hypothetical protein